MQRAYFIFIVKMLVYCLFLNPNGRSATSYMLLDGLLSDTVTFAVVALSGFKCNDCEFPLSSGVGNPRSFIRGSKFFHLLVLVKRGVTLVNLCLPALCGIGTKHKIFSDTSHVISFCTYNI